MNNMCLFCRCNSTNKNDSIYYFSFLCENKPRLEECMCRFINEGDRCEETDNNHFDVSSLVGTEYICVYIYVHLCNANGLVFRGGILMETNVTRLDGLQEYALLQSHLNYGIAARPRRRQFDSVERDLTWRKLRMNTLALLRSSSNEHFSHSNYKQTSVSQDSFFSIFQCSSPSSPIEWEYRENWKSDVTL